MNADQIERLAKLDALRARGALTEEEFETEKRKLLSERRRWPLFASAAAAGVVAVALAGTWIAQEEPTRQAPSDRAPIAAPSPTPTTAPAVTSQTPAERLTQAFEAATGHRRPFNQTVKGEEYSVSPIKIVALPFGPALLVKREIEDGCHACVGFLGVYYLREDQGQSIVTASYPEAVSGWGWGAAPSEWQVTDRFTAYPAIYASGGYSGQGITVSSAAVTELRPDGPSTSDVIGLGYSDAGAITDDNPRPGCELEGKITKVVKDRRRRPKVGARAAWCGIRKGRASR